MALIALRHMPPAIDGGICYGRSDIPVRGADAETLKRLRAALPGAIVAVDSSPLARCCDLALGIADALKVPVQIDERLAEMDFGRWEMCAWDDIPRAEIDLWAADVRGACPHGGESVEAVIGRARGYLADRAQVDGDVLAVTHLGVMRCMLAALDRPDALDTKVGFGEFITINAEGNL